MTEAISYIPARIKNAAVGGHVTGAEDIDFGAKVIHLIKYDKDGHEISFESQITQANKIYVIHDDFALSSNVTIPANCILQFEGGSIANASGNSYTITGQKTNIYSPKVAIFNSVVLHGTFANNELFTSWFGLTNSAADATSNSAKMNTYLVPSCTNTGCDLIVDSEIYINSPFSINSYLFNLKCLKRIYYNGTQNYNGGVIAIENTGNWYVQRHHVIDIQNVNTDGDLATRKAYGICGVTINNLGYSCVDIKFVCGFTYGCVICSSLSSQGNFGNKYNLYHIHNCYKGLVLRAIVSGWVNDNLFNGGEIRCDSENVFSPDHIGISFENNLSSGYASFNNNVFIKPDIEACTVGIYVSPNTFVEDGKFISVRTESVTTLIEDEGYDRSIEHKSIIIPYYYQEKYRNMMTRNFFVKYDFDAVREYDIPIEGILTGTTNISCFKGAHLLQKGVDSKFILRNQININGIVDDNFVKVDNAYSSLGFVFLNTTGRFSCILRLKGKSGTEGDGKLFLVDDTGTVVSTSGIKTNMYDGGVNGWYISSFDIPESGILDYSMWMEDIPASVTKIIVVGKGTLSSLSLITYGSNPNCFNENKVLAGNGTSTLFKFPESDYAGYGGYIPVINIDTGKPMWRINAQWVDALGNPINTVYPKVVGTPTNGNLVKFNSTNIEDAGKELSELQLEVTGTAGNFAGFDSNGKLADSGSKSSDFEPAQS